MARVFRLTPLFWFVFLLVNLIVAVRSGLDVVTADYAAAAAQWLLFIALPPLGAWMPVVAYAPCTLTYEWLCYFTLPGPLTLRAVPIECGINDRREDYRGLDAYRLNRVRSAHDCRSAGLPNGASTTHC